MIMIFSKFTMNNISELEKLKLLIHLRNKLLYKFSEKKFKIKLFKSFTKYILT